MNLKLIADENIPYQIVSELRKVGYDVLMMKDVAHTGIQNNELAEISVRLDRIIMTRDADFTKLTEPVIGKVKVIYVKLTGDPDKIAELVLDNVRNCALVLERHNIVVFNDEGCHAL